MTDNSKKIIAILLDGKRVKFPINYNVKEGWIEFEVLKPSKDISLIQSGESVNVEDSNNNKEPVWEYRKEFGKVEVVYS